MISQLTTLLILAILGLAITIYLVYTRTQKKALACNNDQCHAVLDSKYNKIFGINNDILGVLYYLVIIIEYFLLTALMTNMIIYFQIITSIALLGSIYLLYIQAFVLRKYCIYCIGTAIINFGIFWIIIIL